VSFELYTIVHAATQADVSRHEIARETLLRKVLGGKDPQVVALFRQWSRRYGLETKAKQVLQARRALVELLGLDDWLDLYGEGKLKVPPDRLDDFQPLYDVFLTAARDQVLRGGRAQPRGLARPRAGGHRGLYR
jgi:hypothetical protein